MATRCQVALEHDCRNDKTSQKSDVPPYHLQSGTSRWQRRRNDHSADVTDRLSHPHNKIDNNIQHDYWPNLVARWFSADARFCRGAASCMALAATTVLRTISKGVLAHDAFVRTNRCAIAVMFVRLSVCLGRTYTVIVRCTLART